MTVVARFKLSAARLMTPDAGVVGSSATQCIGACVFLRVHVVLVCVGIATD